MGTETISIQTNHLPVHNNDLFTMFTLLTMVFKFICFTLITSITKGEKKGEKERKYKHLNQIRKKKTDEREAEVFVWLCFTFKLGNCVCCVIT